MASKEEQNSAHDRAVNVGDIHSCVVPPAITDSRANSATDPTQWVDDHGDYLYRYALVRIRISEIAEDLVQETFLAAIRSHDTFAGRSTERSWLCAILKNKIIHYYRVLGRETPFTDMEFLSGEFAEKFVAQGWWVHADAPKEWKPEPDVVAHRSEFWTVMHDCLGKLPDRIANVFMMREMDEVSAKEICKTLSISENNLWVMLHRARMALRECLEKNWFKKGNE
jgi:RNA polymerase sigma-70 factor (ECF subfamily)